MRKTLLLIAITAGLSAYGADRLLPAALAVVQVPTEEYADASYQIDHEYDRYGRVVRLKTVYPNYPEYCSEKVYEYTDYKPGLYSTADVVNIIDGKRDMAYRYTRTYDAQDRIISEGTLNIGAEGEYLIRNVDIYDYTHSEVGLRLGGAQYKVDRVTLKDIEQISQPNVVFCPAMNSYVTCSNGGSTKIEVVDNCKVTRNYEQGKLTRECYEYFSDGKKLGSKTKTVQYPYDDPENFYWSGSMTETTVNGNVTTEIIYNVDSKNGEWVPSSKTVTTGKFSTPLVNGSKVNYGWYNGDWVENSRLTYSWLSKSLRQCQRGMNGQIYDYDLFMADGTFFGSADKLGDNLYLVNKEDQGNNRTDMYYFNTQGNELRHLRADHKYLFVDQYSELIYGEWIVPTQPFYICNRDITALISLCDDNGNPVALAECVYSDGKMQNIGSVFFSSEKANGVPTSWSRDQVGIYGHEDYGRGTVKWINDNVIGIEYYNGFNSSSKGKHYIEYDVKQRVIHGFSKQDNMWVYNWSYFPRCFDEHKNAEGNWVSFTKNYDRATNVNTVIRTITIDGENKSVIKQMETFNPETQTWIPSGRSEVKNTLQPDWIDFAFYQGQTRTDLVSLEIGYSIKKSDYEDVRTVNSRLNPDSSQPVYDTETLSYEMNSTTGQLELTSHSYVDYENSRSRIARHVVTEKPERRNTVSYVYELNADRLPVRHYITEVEEADGNRTDKVTYELRLGYDSKNRPVYHRAKNGTETRVAYDESYDLLNDFKYDFVFERIDEVETENSEITVEGLTIAVTDARLLQLYGIDGRMSGSSASGRVTAPSRGIYLLRINNSQVRKLCL